MSVLNKKAHVCDPIYIHRNLINVSVLMSGELGTLVTIYCAFHNLSVFQKCLCIFKPYLIITVVYDPAIYIVPPKFILFVLSIKFTNLAIYLGKVRDNSYLLRMFRSSSSVISPCNQSISVRPTFS